MVDTTAAVVAEPFLHLAAASEVLDLAKDAVAAWKQIRAQASGMTGEEALALTRRVLAEHDVLPSGIRARLLSDPIQG